MPTLTAALVLRYGSKNLPNQFQTISIDEDAYFESYTLTSNQSGLAINYGPVTTGQALFFYAGVDASGSLAVNSGTTYGFDSNAFMLWFKMSNSALTLTNLQTTGLMTVTIGIFGT